ncbi:hypothetical protein IW140_003291 [Coemansia sp. RSA 1813]|nr:hypothetical protein EV178_002911 [Coemansia sp. RSA 1646]KAJ1771700.1 hypothetical protein LPJ74_002127 [Coemansia sp. RSA 1843]KAJ2089664.1 hypothetical protein IW138_003262 [Coemansia sp. RSA 986]KAJ2214141.1 hypothetical protein EV179_003280 [Coemansia sp. RSA 487]KAJ2569199.1 hypothetical protein IW140_003291 [Coemansia sp. RSA 1813]
MDGENKTETIQYYDGSSKDKLSFTKDAKNPGRFVFTMPKPPTFDDFESERVHRKQRLVAAFRVFAKLGLDEGVAGHLTCRDPEHPHLFWVNPFGRSFACIGIKDLILVDAEGAVVHGNSPLNAAAFVIHSKIHAARPDAVAACHSHSMYGKAFSSLGVPLQPITQDACIFYNDHAVFPGFNGVVADEVEGARMADTLRGYKALVLQNHGLLTVGKTVDEAAFWFIALDRCCKAQMLAMAAGTPQCISDQVAADARDTVGSTLAGWFSFQPYFQQITKEQPDILEVDDQDGKLTF